MIEYCYKEIKCPKCGKAYFRVKQHNTDFGYDILPAVFNHHPDRIYKDGILQNPEPINPAIERFQCMECGCNFRTETYPANGDIAVVPNIVNEDEEENIFEKIIREHNEEVAKQKEIQEEVEQVAKLTGAKLDKEFQQRTNECQQDFDGGRIIGTVNIPSSDLLVDYSKNLTNTITVKSTEPTISYILDDTKISTTLYEELKDKIENISNRLNKIEEKLNDN